MLICLSKSVRTKKTLEGSALLPVQRLRRSVRRKFMRFRELKQPSRRQRSGSCQ